MRTLVDSPRILVGLACTGLFLAGIGVSVAKNDKTAAAAAAEESAAAKIAAAKAKTGFSGKTVPDNAPAALSAAERTRVVPLADDGKGPDVSALRFYVSQGQKDRVETEIKRLQTLYPTWQVPSSIYDTRAAGAIDEQPFWDLFAAGEMDRLRAEIAKRMREEPGWKPSEDLMDKIHRKNQRTQITKLWKSGKWKKLLAFVKAENFGVADADVDIMWTVAEAYAKTKQLDNALGIYKSIMKHNLVPEQRLATIQKSMATLPMSLVEELIKLSKADASGQSELAPIATDITRARISAFLHDERSEEVDKKEVKEFEKYARKAKDPNQPGLVAWYNYKRKVFPEALEWFKFSISRGGDTMIAHGLAHTLRELELKRDTEEVSYAWRQPLVNNAILFIDILERDLTRKIPPYIEPQRLRRYAQVTMDSASGEGAQGLAWYAYNTCQFKVALQWFRHANAWHPKEGTAYGLAITLRRLKQKGEFWDLINRYDGLFPKVIEIIYPDDYIHPPTPCDITTRYLARMRAKLMRGGGLIATPRAPYPQGQPYPGYLARGQTLTPSSVLPGANPAFPANRLQPAAALNGSLAPWQRQHARGFKRLPLRKNIREPKISKSLFPVSVDSQNPLRRWPSGRLMGPPAPQAFVRRGKLRGLQAEPPLKMDNLVARRVPGVGPMPYERWGYALLPSYKGGLTASAPHEAVSAPKGTLWTTLHAKDAESTREDGDSFFDMTTLAGLRNAELALRAIKGAPRVPAPGESKSGPWSSPKPYKSEKQLAAEKGPVTGANAVADAAPRQAPVIRASLTAAAVTKVNQAPLSAELKPADKETGTKKPGLPVAGNPVAVSVNKQKKSNADRAALAEARKLLKKSTPADGPITIVPNNRARPAPGLRLETGARDELGRLATDLYNKKQYAKALEALNKRAARLPETSRLRMLRAWSLLNLRRVDEAREIFATLGSGRRAANARASTRKN